MNRDSENVLEKGSPGARKIDAMTLTDRAYEMIETRIVALDLEPGQVLSESQLVDELGIGRTPVREALQRLAAEGLVVVMPRRGVMVSEINIAKQLQLLELRREVERLCACKAAQRATEAERAQFEALAAKLAASAEARDYDAFMQLDLEFNRAVLAACRNEFIERSMRRMQGLSRRFWFQNYRVALDLERCANLHADVARKISEGDQAAAGEASDRLIDYIYEFTRATL
ncbi:MULTISPECIES: GntR family transcriptional regulator [unclassified Roseovarius]|uniref:GntR family transcriptional regulator n=1 Tax=unclassified Roseovarius TaxID=2614913 RepID=UPI00273F2119|nr:GntR family transcriptional regulator [Roseovarius sp. MMSF_3350]